MKFIPTYDPAETEPEPEIIEADPTEGYGQPSRSMPADVVPGTVRYNEWVDYLEHNAHADWWHQRMGDPDQVAAQRGHFADIYQHEADLRQQAAARMLTQESYRDPLCGGDDGYRPTSSRIYAVSAKPAEMSRGAQLLIILLFGFVVIGFMLWIGG